MASKILIQKACEIGKVRSLIVLCWDAKIVLPAHLLMPMFVDHSSLGL